jgi:hypothetical protein
MKKGFWFQLVQSLFGGKFLVLCANHACGATETALFERTGHFLRRQQVSHGHASNEFALGCQSHSHPPCARENLVMRNYCVPDKKLLFAAPAHLGNAAKTEEWEPRFPLHKRSRSQSKGPSKKSSSRRQASALHHEEHGKKILERRRFSLLIGIMIGCCIVLLSDYTGLHKVPMSWQWPTTSIPQHEVLPICDVF